jgi:hypothetical protein
VLRRQEQFAAGKTLWSGRLGPACPLARNPGWSTNPESAIEEQVGRGSWSNGRNFICFSKMATWHFGPWLQLSMDEKAGLGRMTGEQAFFFIFFDL